MKKLLLTLAIALIPSFSQAQNVGGLIDGENYQDLLTAFPGNAVSYNEEEFSLVFDLDTAQSTSHNCITPNLNLLNDRELNSSAVIVALNYDLKGNTVNVQGSIKGMSNNNAVTFVVLQDRSNGKSYWYEFTNSYKAAGEDDDTFRVTKTDDCGGNVQNGLPYVPVVRNHYDLDRHFVYINANHLFQTEFSLGFRCYENKTVSIGSSLSWNVFLVAQKRDINQSSEPIHFKSFAISGASDGSRPYQTLENSVWPGGCFGQEFDSDGDGILDSQDNCPTKYNPSQTTMQDLNFAGYENYDSELGIWCDCDAQWIAMSMVAGSQPQYVLNYAFGDWEGRQSLGYDLMPSAFWSCSQPD